MTLLESAGDHRGSSGHSLDHEYAETVVANRRKHEDIAVIVVINQSRPVADPTVEGNFFRHLGRHHRLEAGRIRSPVVRPREKLGLEPG